MDKQRQNSVYVNMMVDTLRRKETILTILHEQTQQQERLLKEQELDLEQFQHLLDLKGEKIQELNELDEGFDALFRMVQKDISADKERYREEIQTMQKLIGTVTELGVKIQALEHQNSERLKIYLATQRKTIRDFHVNHKMAESYYKNMADSHKPEQSYFFNEKK